MGPASTVGARILHYLAEDRGVSAVPPPELVRLFDQALDRVELFNPLFAAFVMREIEAGDPIVDKVLHSLPRFSSVLDCGSGIGRYSFYVAERECRVQSWEMNDAYVAFQRWIAREQNLPVIVHQGDFLAISEGRFDLILCLFITLPDHSEDRLIAFFSWAKSRLAEGGRLVIDAYTPAHFMEMFGDPDSTDRTPFGTLHRRARSLPGNRIRVTHVWTVDGVDRPEESYEYRLPDDPSVVAAAARSVGLTSRFLTDKVLVLEHACEHA